MCVPKRCGWCGSDPDYVKYHDTEWGVPVHDDVKLFEALILEMFEAGLSWITILRKRDAFRSAFDGFDVDAVCGYGEDKINSLMQNAGIVRSRRKIESAIANARAFRSITLEFGSFDAYIWSFTGCGSIPDGGASADALCERVCVDMRSRGMKFLGVVTVRSYLQAIGVINAHERGCYLYAGEN